MTAFTFCGTPIMTKYKNHMKLKWTFFTYPKFQEQKQLNYVYVFVT